MEEKISRLVIYVYVFFLIGFGFSNRLVGCLGKNKEFGVRCLRWFEFYYFVKDLEGVVFVFIVVVGI